MGLSEIGATKNPVLIILGKPTGVFHFGVSITVRMRFCSTAPCFYGQLFNTGRKTNNRSVYPMVSCISHEENGFVTLIFHTSLVSCKDLMAH